MKEADGRTTNTGVIAAAQHGGGCARLVRLRDNMSNSGNMK